MERELWKIISRQITAVDRHFTKGQYTHSIGRVVRVYLWAVLHDRPVYWACRRENWPGVRPPNVLPDQSRMSRRLRQKDTHAFLDELTQRLFERPECDLVKMLDGKPLTVARHSQDADATYGYGAGGMCRGYKLHAIYGKSSTPLAWKVHPINIAESMVARDLIKELTDEGYLLADKNYDRNPLYDLAHTHGHQFVAPRHKPKTGLGHRHHSPQRVRAIALLEGPGTFGRKLFVKRRGIESRFGHLSSFGGGLTCLPAWVRSLPRVRLFVHAKLLIRAARDIIIRQGAA